MTRAPITDQQIHAAILKRLGWAPEIDPAHVAVSVRQGIVTVSGTAVSAAEKRAAEQAAAVVQGVVAVIDEIVVPAAIGTVDDSDIGESVRTVLQYHPQLAGEQIAVNVHNQVVRLTGMVNSEQNRRAARRSAQAVLGVRTVIDELRLPPAPTESQTKARLTEMLTRAGTAHPEQLDIHLDGHVATLEGNVHSWYERRVAEKAARSVPGVTDVLNRLVVTF